MGSGDDETDYTTSRASTSQSDSTCTTDMRSARGRVSSSLSLSSPDKDGSPSRSSSAASGSSPPPPPPPARDRDGERLRTHTRTGARVEVRGVAGGGRQAYIADRRPSPSSGSMLPAAAAAVAVAVALEPSRPTPVKNFKEVYDIQAEIGHGSYAVVYRASDRSGQVYALKSVIRAKLTARLQQSLQSEISLLLHFKQPHIVELKAVEEDIGAGVINLVMEYCSMGDLSGFIKRGASGPQDGGIGKAWPGPPAGGLHVGVVRHLLQQLGSALQYLSMQNCIHRDIKPQNLLLSPTALAFQGAIPDLPLLKVADFGFARFLKLGDMADTLCGSPLYMAPEILAFKTYDNRADLWSVGAVLYEMVTGRPPFRADNHVQLAARIKEAKDRVLFPDEVDSWSTTRQGQPVPVPIKLLIRSLLKRDPETRLTFRQFLAHPVVGLAEMRRNGATYVRPIDEAQRSARKDAGQAAGPGKTQASSSLPKKVAPPRPDLPPIVGVRTPSGAENFVPKYVVEETGVSQHKSHSSPEEAEPMQPQAGPLEGQMSGPAPSSTSETTPLVSRGLAKEGVPTMTKESVPTMVPLRRSPSHATVSPAESGNSRLTQGSQPRTESRTALAPPTPVHDPGSDSLVEKEYVMIDGNQVKSFSSSPVATTTTTTTTSPKMPPFFRRPSMGAAYAGAAGAMKRLSFGRSATTPETHAPLPLSQRIAKVSASSPGSEQPSLIPAREAAATDVAAFSTSAPLNHTLSTSRGARTLSDRSLDSQRAKSFTRDVVDSGSPPAFKAPEGSPRLVPISTSRSRMSPRAMSLGSTSSSSALAKAINLNSIRLLGTSPKAGLRFSPDASQGSGIWLTQDALVVGSLATVSLPGSVDQIEAEIMRSLQNLGQRAKAVGDFATHLLSQGQKESGFVILIKSLESYQRGIEIAQAFWADHQVRSPSIQFSDAVQWFKTKFDVALERAEKLRTSEMEMADGPDPNRLLYMRALEISRFALGAEVNSNDLASCSLGYTTSLALLDVILDSEAGSGSLPLEREKIVQVSNALRDRIAALQVRLHPTRRIEPIGGVPMTGKVGEKEAS